MNNEMMPAMGGNTAMAMPHGNASVMVAQSREMAEAIGQMQMAKMCPRDVVAARDRILNACTRPRLAETACYSYVRGGTEVTGPSIRLAEMLAQNWGNMTFGIRELEQRNGESTCEAFAWDMETNARQTKVFQVRHIRHTKNGDKVSTDPRDIYELVANNGARRLRACILGVIPGDIVEEAVCQCDLTLKTKFDVTPERIKGLIEKFGEFKVTAQQIEARIQCRLDAIKPAQLANLGKIYNSIKDGMSKAEDWFPQEQKEASAEAAKTAKKSLRDALGVASAPKAEKATEGDSHATDGELGL
jgi:hypothetical protein